jgi:hypothetical protein
MGKKITLEIDSGFGVASCKRKCGKLSILW